MARKLFQVELPIRSDWESVGRLRDAVLQCIRAIFGDDGWAETLAMVASELLENAVKYGSWSPEADVGRPFSLHVSGNRSAVEITVSNPVDPGDPGLGRLFDELHRIHTAASLETAYVGRMAAVAACAGHRGGLGLFRIAHEAGCLLDAALAPDGVLEVRATWRRAA